MAPVCGWIRSICSLSKGILEVHDEESTMMSPFEVRGIVPGLDGCTVVLCPDSTISGAGGRFARFACS